MREPDEILTDNAETYREKDADYNQSWRQVGEVLSILTGGEEVSLHTPEDFISLGLFTRRLDKIIRSFNGEFLADEMNFESVGDSHADESTYAAMHAALLAEQEPIEFIREADIQRAMNADQVPVSIGYDPNYEYEAGPSVGIVDDDPEIDPDYQAKYEELTGT